MILTRRQYIWAGRRKAVAGSIAYSSTELITIWRFVGVPIYTSRIILKHNA